MGSRLLDGTRLVVFAGGFLALRRQCPAAISRPRRPGSRKLSVPTATSVAPASSSSRACCGALNAAHADDGNLHARRDRGHLGERDRRGSPGPRARRCRRRARGAPPSPPGASAVARSVLISETASAPPRLRAGARRRDVGGVRRQLDDQRLAPCAGAPPRTTRSSSAGSAPMSRPVCTFGQETFSSIAAISARASHASHELGELLGGRAHHVRDHGHRQRGRARRRVAAEAGEQRQVLGQVALEALVRAARSS